MNYFIPCLVHMSYTLDRVGAVYTLMTTELRFLAYLCLLSLKSTNAIIRLISPVEYLDTISNFNMNSEKHLLPYSSKPRPFPHFLHL